MKFLKVMLLAMLFMGAITANAVADNSETESSQVVTTLPDTGTGFAGGKTYTIVSILVGATIGGIVTYRMTED